MTTEATKKLLHYIIFNHGADEVLLNFAYDAVKDEYAAGLNEAIEIVKLIPQQS